jgi:hypothetical protein
MQEGMDGWMDGWMDALGIEIDGEGKGRGM